MLTPMSLLLALSVDPEERLDEDLITKLGSAVGEVGRNTEADMLMRRSCQVKVVRLRILLSEEEEKLFLHSLDFRDPSVQHTIPPSN